MTAICGIVDQLTEDVWTTHSLGNHYRAGYARRVMEAFGALEPAYKQPLSAAGVDSGKVDRFWSDHFESVNRAGGVLAAFRREFSDAHGAASAVAPPALVQRALSCSVFIMRAITPLI